MMNGIGVVWVKEEERLTVMYSFLCLLLDTFFQVADKPVKLRRSYPLIINTTELSHVLASLPFDQSYVKILKDIFLDNSRIGKRNFATQL